MLLEGLCACNPVCALEACASPVRLVGSVWGAELRSEASSFKGPSAFAKGNGSKVTSTPAAKMVYALHSGCKAAISVDCVGLGTMCTRQ